MIKADTKLGKFRVIRQVGKGGMAEVYLAEDTVLGRHVAIKILPPEMARDLDWVKRFSREVKATANLFHPNIVTVYDVGHQENLHFYAMEYLPNGDLNDRIREGISVHKALIYLKQIAKALGYAHNKGFIHRDIKPENILFDEDDNAKLTDLGIAKALNNHSTVTKARESIGTPCYISPEQAHGNTLDGRSDIYSLGIVFYQMLTGEVPYNADDPLAVALSHINAPVPHLPIEFVQYQGFLEAMLAKDENDRFANTDELVDAIEMLEDDREFDLETFYEKRRERKADVLNFGGISEAVDDSARIKIWIAIALVVMVVALGFWQKEKVAAGFDKSVDKLTSLFSSNTADEGTPRGVIQIDSIPSGASVFLNGKEVGTTPYLGQAVPAGEQKLKLTHALHADFETTITVESNKIINQQYTLSTGSGSLNVNSTPAGAYVELNGERLKQKTPMVINDLPTGKHQLVFIKDHLSATLEAEVHNNKEQRIHSALEAGKMAFYPKDWITIPDLYRMAEQLTKNNRLSSPTGNNAEEAYRAILKTDPSQQPAKEKLIELGRKHWALAERAAKRKDLKSTEKHLSHSQRLLKGDYSAAAAQRLMKQARSK